MHQLCQSHLRLTAVVDAVFLCWLDVTRGGGHHVYAQLMRASCPGSPTTVYIGVYMCVCSFVGPVDKSSHAKLMDEIPPLGGFLATCFLCRSLRHPSAHCPPG